MIWMMSYPIYHLLYFFFPSLSFSFFLSFDFLDFWLHCITIMKNFRSKIIFLNLLRSSICEKKNKKEWKNIFFNCLKCKEVIKKNEKNYEEFEKHFLWIIEDPCSAYSAFVIHIVWNVDKEAKIEPPIYRHKNKNEL